MPQRISVIMDRADRKGSAKGRKQLLVYRPVGDGSCMRRLLRGERVVQEGGGCRITVVLVMILD